MHSKSSTPGMVSVVTPRPTRKRRPRHSRTRSCSTLTLSPSNVNMNVGVDFDLLVEKAKGKIEIHEEDFNALFHATEQLVTAQRLKDLGHKVMIETLRTLRCSAKIKKKGNELSDLLHELYLTEIQRTDAFDNLLDSLENVKKTHFETSNALKKECEAAQQRFIEFSRKHPELDLQATNESVSPQSTYSTDEEISDSSVLSSHSTHSSSSIFSFLRTRERNSQVSSQTELLLETGDELKADMHTRRNDFVNAVNILETKSSNLVVSLMNEICDLYRDIDDDLVPPEPLQPL